MSDAAGGLTPHDTAQLILALVDGRGPRGASEGDMAKILEWGHSTFVSWVLLQMAIEGRVRLDLNADGEVIFIHNKPEPAPS